MNYIVVFNFSEFIIKLSVKCPCIFTALKITNKNKSTVKLYYCGYQAPSPPSSSPLSTHFLSLSNTTTLCRSSPPLLLPHAHSE